jgi:hypothetical protein
MRSCSLNVVPGESPPLVTLGSSITIHPMATLDDYHSWENWLNSVPTKVVNDKGTLSFNVRNFDVKHCS